MEGAFYFVYETANLTRKELGINPYIYIGQHCTINLNDGYFGSSKELQKDVSSGDIFQVQILKHYTNIFDLGNAEYDLIKERKAINNPVYYNKSNWRFYNTMFEYGLSSKSKEKISNSLTGKIQSELSNQKRRIKTPWNKGKTDVYSKETRKQISDSLKDKKLTKRHSKNISEGTKKWWENRKLNNLKTK